MIKLDKFKTIKEATAHHDFLSKQIENLGYFILERFPDMDGEYYSNGACGAAIFIMMDYLAGRPVGQYPLPDEYLKLAYISEDEVKCEQ